MDIEKLLEKDAFKKIEQESLLAFKELAKEINGKNKMDAMNSILNFQKAMPKGRKLSKEEYGAMQECIIESLSDEDKKKFMDLIKLFDTIKTINNK